MWIKNLYEFCTYGKSYKALDNQDKLELKKRADKYLYKSIRFIVILFLIIQLMYIATGVLSKVFHSPYAINNIASILLVMISSVIVLIMSFAKNKRLEASIQHIAFIYYLIIEVSMLIMLQSNLARSTEFVTTVYFAYIILAMLPIQILAYDLLLFLFLIIGSTLVFIFTPSNVSTSAYLLMYSIMIIGLLASSYVRFSYFRGFLHQYRYNETTKELEKLSTTDFLTSLPNRQALNSYLEESLKDSIAKGLIVGVAMLDIDNFKSYNDYYSHLIGDECLKRISRAISMVSDRLGMNAFRYGGEEFLIIDPNSSKARMDELGSAIIKEVNELNIFRCDLDELHERVTLSCGAHSRVLKRADEYEMALKLADEALYISKKTGKNKYTYKS